MKMRGERILSRGRKGLVTDTVVFFKKALPGWQENRKGCGK